MNHTGPTGLPGGRGVWIGPGPCVAGAHLAVFGPDLNHTGTGLVFGTDLGPPVADSLEQAINPGAGGVHLAGGHHLGAQVCRVPGRDANLSICAVPMESVSEDQVAGNSPEWHRQPQ